MEGSYHDMPIIPKTKIKTSIANLLRKAGRNIETILFHAQLREQLDKKLRGAMGMSMEKNKDVKNPDELTLAELGNLSDEELLAMDWLKGFVLPELVVVIEDNPSPISPEELLKLDKYLIAEEIERSYEEQYGEK